MKIKDGVLLNMIYLSLTEWLYKIYVKGLVLPRYSKYRGKAKRTFPNQPTFEEFCHVFTYVIIVRDNRELEQEIILSLQSWLKKVYAIDTEEASVIIANYFHDKKYLTFLEVVRITEKVFKWTDNFEDWSYL